MRCVILALIPLSFHTMEVPRVSTQRQDEDLLAYTTPAFLHDTVQWKKVIFTSLDCKVGLGDCSKSGVVRILNCSINFVKLECILLLSTSYNEQPIGQGTWKEGNNGNNTQSAIHLPVCQISFWPFEFSREKVIFPHIWDTTSWFLHHLICFFI